MICQRKERTVLTEHSVNFSMLLLRLISPVFLLFLQLPKLNIFRVVLIVFMVKGPVVELN